MIQVRLSQVSKSFPVGEGILRRSRTRVKAVDNVSLELEKGSILGLVGESGSGKTTLGRISVGLLKPDSGSVEADLGSGLVNIYSKGLDRKARKKLQMIYQDPETSLDPRFSVKATLAEALRAAGDREDMAEELLKMVGLPGEVLHKLPHQLSGGQRQRVAIARALAVRPQLLVADEPTSALDATTRTQILNLLLKLNREMGLTIITITHDLGMAAYLADKIAVMYGGRILELGPLEEVIKDPRHPYTVVLLSSSPAMKSLLRIGMSAREAEERGEQVPENACVFYSRCPIARRECRDSRPELVESGKGHFAACIFTREGLPENMGR